MLVNDLQILGSSVEQFLLQYESVSFENSTSLESKVFIFLNRGVEHNSEHLAFTLYVLGKKNYCM